MYKITVKGDASTNYPNLQRLDGTDCQDEFSEYFHERYEERINEQPLIDKGVCNGYMNFEYDQNSNKLYTITTYDSPEKLTDEELEILKEYTQGQWSDGIGKGFEQFPLFEDKNWDNEDNDHEVYLSPWHRNQIINIEQIEI